MESRRKQPLVCPFCGTESAARLDRGGAIAEHDLVGALRAVAAALRGAGGTAKREVKCQSCNAISVLDPSRQAQNCEFCGSAQLVPYAEANAAHRPESVLPFKVSETEARDRIRAWYGKLWLAPSALAKKALTDTVRGVYLPYWTFDARVDAEWTAEAGHYYYTTETYEQDGRVQTRQVQHVRWEPAAGRVSAFFRRRPRLRVGGRAPGAAARHRALSDEGARSPTTPGFVAGWIVERYQIDLAAAAQRGARGDGREVAGAVRAAGSRRHVPQSRRAAPITRHRRSSTSSRRCGCSRYTYGARAFQCAMNGVTGTIRGEYPKSPWKIALLVVAIVVVLWIVLSFGRALRQSRT